MNKIFLFLIINCLPILSGINCFSQSPDWLWAKSMGGAGSGEYAYSIAVDVSGNIYTTGRFQGTSDFDPGAGTFYLTAPGGVADFISKLDSAGNFIWAKLIGSTVTAIGRSIAVDASGSVYTTGYFVGTADLDPGPGVFSFSSPSYYVFFISKLDSSGDFVWAKTIAGTSGDTEGNSITIDPAGSGAVYTTGYFMGTVDFDPGAGIFNLTSAGGRDIFISKLDTAGNFIWAKALGGSGTQSGLSIALDPAGSGAVYTTGYFQTTTDFDPGAGTFNLTATVGQDIFISKLDTAGNFIWAKAIGGTANIDEAYDIAVDTAGNGGVFISGYFNGTVDFDPGPGVYNLSDVGTVGDMFIAKLNSAGDFVWAGAIGTATFSDQMFSIAPDPMGSGSIYATGKCGYPADFDPGPAVFNVTSGSYLFVLKLDSAGNFLWVKSTTSGTSANGYSIAINTFGYVHVTGNFGSSPVSFDSVTLNSAGASDIFIAKLDTVSFPTGINVAENEADDILVFPNPATKEIRVQSSKFKLQRVDVYDMLCQLQTSNFKPQTSSIDVSSLAPGIYFIRVTSENEFITKKFIKQ